MRLFKQNGQANASFYKEHPEAFRQRQEKWLLLPKYHVFGSDELSIYTKGVLELAPEPYVGLSRADAAKLGAAENSIVTIEAETQQLSYPLKIFSELTNGIVLLPKGLPGMQGMRWGNWVRVLAGVSPLTSHIK